MSERDDQRAKVVNSTKKDRSKHNPEKCRKPAPDHPDGRTDDRCCTCNGSEMVSEEDGLKRRHMIDPILKNMRGRSYSWIQRKDLLSKKSRIETVCQNKTSE